MSGQAQSSQASDIFLSQQARKEFAALDREATDSVASLMHLVLKLQTEVGMLKHTMQISEQERAIKAADEARESARIAREKALEEKEETQQQIRKNIDENYASLLEHVKKLWFILIEDDSNDALKDLDLDKAEPYIKRIMVEVDSYSLTYDILSSAIDIFMTSEVSPLALINAIKDLKKTRNYYRDHKDEMTEGERQLFEEGLRWKRNVVRISIVAVLILATITLTLCAPATVAALPVVSTLSSHMMLLQSMLHTVSVLAAFAKNRANRLINKAKMSMKVNAHQKAIETATKEIGDQEAQLAVIEADFAATNPDLEGDEAVNFVGSDSDVDSDADSDAESEEGPVFKDILGLNIPNIREALRAAEAERDTGIGLAGPPEATVEDSEPLLDDEARAKIDDARLKRDLEKIAGLPGGDALLAPIIAIQEGLNELEKKIQRVDKKASDVIRFVERAGFPSLAKIAKGIAWPIRMAVKGIVYIKHGLGYSWGQMKKGLAYATATQAERDVHENIKKTMLTGLKKAKTAFPKKKHRTPPTLEPEGDKLPLARGPSDSYYQGEPLLTQFGVDSDGLDDDVEAGDKPTVHAYLKPGVTSDKS